MLQGSGHARMSTVALGQLMPMCLWLGPDHTILSMGPTLEKIIGGPDAIGKSFHDVFLIGRGGARTCAKLEPTRRIHLSLRKKPAISLRGALVQSDGGGFILNLTFGIHLTEAIREFSMTEADFASSDLAMELLYLQEAKTVVLNELRGLNRRLEDARRSAEDQARTDALTGLSNRRAFDAALSSALVDRRLSGRPFALAHLDLDHFKAVNDTLGHAAGDQVLTQVARILREETRDRDVVARVGGDEFVLLLRDILDPAPLQALGVRIISRLEEPVPFENTVCRISGSIGVVISSNYDDPTPEQMMADADAVLYQSKREGRARCTIAPPPLGQQVVTEIRTAG
ncbi:hypothetical protein BFP70_10975 [Thioclava sp. SK-1]|nr:hypothetical protein BFP70_10975 [Thioclava sp. SK-1]